MIQILFFIENLAGGGAEKVLRNLVNNMDQSRFAITVQTVEKGDPALLVPGIRYKAINRCKTPAGKKLFSLWLRLCAQLKWLYPLYIRGDFDIEVACLECGSTKIMAASTNQKALKLAWVHCDLEKKEGFREQLEAQRKYYSAYDQIVCVSKTVRKSFSGLIGAGYPTCVLYNVNDEAVIQQRADAFAVPPEICPTVAVIGRISQEKGVDRAVEACGLLREKGYDFRLQVIGDGPQRALLEQMIRQKELADCVQLLGFQENPYPYMKQADIILCPSRYEGFSTVVTEALILGKCVVTTACSGMDELLGENRYGLITENSVEGIRNGMQQLLDDPQRIADYAVAAAERGKAFSKDALLNATQDFFAQELAKKRSQ